LKPKLVALNLILVAIVGATVWEGRARWTEAQALRKSTLNVPVKPVPPPPFAPVPQPQTPPAITYADVAKKNLFSSDRNDDIVVEPPKVEAPKQMPPLPISTGVMKMPSGVKVFLAEKPGDTPRAVKLNDTLGEFKVIALDERDITFLWNGKPIQRKIEDLIDRSNHDRGGGSQVAAAAPAAPAPSTPNVPPPPPGTPLLGKTLTETQKACVPGDVAPAGTVLDGFRKVISQSPFGPVCRWNKQ
jgi:hypothetical protein